MSQALPPPPKTLPPSPPLDKHLPPTPPPHVYSQVHVRSSGPQIEPRNDRYNTNEIAFRNNKGGKSSYFDGGVAMMAYGDTAARPATSPNTNFRAQYSEPTSPINTLNPEIISTPPVESASGYGQPSALNIIKRRPLDERSSNLSVDAAHRRVASENPQFALQTMSTNERQARHVSMSVLEDDVPVENHQPLQYHHRAVEDAQMKVLSDRTSKMTMGPSTSDGPDQLGLPNMRNSNLASGLQRPDSGFSSTSEFRGRTHSPQASPYLAPLNHVRASSRHSRSPETRPLSYVDLLNVPYPQPAPSGTEGLVNTGLRTVVGNNAALLSTKKTLDMYRANVKKTNDPAIQYEFAVFMISAAQDAGLEMEISSDATVQKSNGSIRDDFLKEAKHILQKLCDRSYPFAQYYLADGYASGLFNNGKPDLDRSFPLFLAASKHGHAEAMYRTALCYEWGWGCRVDAAKAVQFYQHAASKNHPGAMLRLGRACLTGDMGLGKRYREGLRWLKRGTESADFQYNQAPYDLACLHESGYGADVFKDESYAAQLYTRAADLGHKEASFRMGEAYEFGQLNCPKDAALSIHFYTGAAEQGHASAQMALCAWYMVGVENVLEKDESEAYEWAHKAAEQGLPKAQYTVGYFTEMGIGCRRDPLEANVWYVRAAEQGEERARHRITAIRNAAAGSDPMTAAKKKEAATVAENEKKKRFGIF